MLGSGVEGLVGVEALPGSGWHYDEQRMSLTSFDGSRVFSFGMPLEVVCTGAAPESGQIDFRLAGEAAPAPPAQRTERREPSRPGRRDRNPRAMHVPKSRKGRKKR